MDAKRGSCCAFVTLVTFACLFAGCTRSEETRRTAARTGTMPLLPDGTLASVTSVDTGVVAVGHDGAGRGVVLTSADGATWTRVTPAPTTHLPPLLATSRWRQGVIAFAANGDPSVWISADARSWERAVMRSPPFADAGITDVAHGGPGLVAVGWVEDPGETSEPVGGLIWTSTDAITWRRTGDERLFDLNEGNMTAITRGGPGLVVAGLDIDGSVLWTSTDGLHWTRLPRDSVFRGAGITAITEFEGGMLALGARFPDNAPLVWRSSNGQPWVREPGDPPFGPGTLVTDVTRFGSQLVAVGRDSVGVAIWTSADGRAWAAVARPP